MAFFRCQVAGDKGAHSTLPVSVSGGAVPALLALLDEQSSLSFGTLLKRPRGGGGMLKAFGQMYSPPSLDVPPKRQNSEFRWQFSFIPRQTDTYAGYTDHVSFQQVLEQ